MTHPSLRTATWLGLSRGLNPEEYGIASEVETYGYHGNSRVDAGPPNSRQNLSCPISQITGRCLHRLCQRPVHGVRPLGCWSGRCPNGLLRHRGEGSKISCCRHEPSQGAGAGWPPEPVLLQNARPHKDSGPHYPQTRHGRRVPTDSLHSGGN